MKKRKAKIVVKNGMRDKVGQILGRTEPSTGKVEINVNANAHKDKRELASTIKHEILHVKHPKMTEKETYKRSRKTRISPQEQEKLVAKLRMKEINYKMGVTKRKLKMKRGDVEPGALISKLNEQMSERKRVSISGLV